MRKRKERGKKEHLPISSLLCYFYKKTDCIVMDGCISKQELMEAVNTYLHCISCLLNGSPKSNILLWTIVEPWGMSDPYIISGSE
jgi:hypothetical protein